MAGALSKWEAAAGNYEMALAQIEACVVVLKLHVQACVVIQACMVMLKPMSMYTRAW